jgi:hypothetical protein
VGEAIIKEGFLSDLTRPYVETTTNPGARTLIYIEQHGNDLYTSWRSYLRPTINWRLISYYAIVALIISFVIDSIYWSVSTYNILNAVFHMWDAKPFSIAFWTCFGYSMVFSLGLIVLFALLGQLIKKDFTKFLGTGFLISIFVVSFICSSLIKDTGQTMANELSLLSTRVKDGYLLVVIPVAIIPLAINILEGILVMAAIVGLIIRKNLLAFILKEPSIFDADDIIAMNLSVHKTMLRVLDEVGIDNSKLRLKGQYKSGRSGEVV